MNRNEAEDFVYKSYLKAEKYQDYDAKDSEKRRPDLTKSIIRSKAGTPCVVVTGSKGKGSVSNMISQILQSAYKVGLMTSPHLVDFCERFNMNGKSISDDDFAKYMSRIKAEIDEIDSRIPKNVCISPMGIQTDLALEYFNSNHTDFNVMECGKGAKFDDVNNVKHEYAVINSIFLEHTRELGDTLEAIAEDKSYVITGEQKCIYVAEQQPGVLKVIQNRANEFGTAIKVYGIDFKAENIRYARSGMIFDVIAGERVFKDISIPLMGEHQAKNCALAMALCLDVLGDLNLDIVKEKLAELDWPGRMEIISSDPFIMLDACIHSASCGNVKDVMTHLGIGKAVVIIGIPNDKDYAGVVREMNMIADNIILTKSQSQHYVFSDEQCVCMAKEGIHTTWADSVGEAIKAALRSERPVVILGTTSVVSEVKKYFNKNVIPIMNRTLGRNIDERNNCI